ncbi:MAG: hypothetical protein H3C32_12575 [Anaerolineae bacterium]|nr:MAG: hypothetical protein UZ13_02866 [Chloroflexi bacterium OLB13]MBW7880131.1 hypothetical protein [Anaerolineae bacterium]
MSKTYSVAQDLKEAQAFVDSLETYVQGDQVYGSVGGGWFTGGRMPALTAGSLAMRLRRLHVLQTQLSGDQLEQLAQIEAKRASVVKAWHEHYRAKLEREVVSRLDAMRPFFEEAKTDPKLAVKVYGPEVLRRTIAEEALIALEEMGEDVKDLTLKAKAADSMLRRYVKPGEFAWAEALIPAYPRERFWWMYVEPNEPAK